MSAVPATEALAGTTVDVFTFDPRQWVSVNEGGSVPGHAGPAFYRITHTTSG